MKIGLKAGDYVLATKWRDGDPGDQWCVGFYTETDDRGRYYVVDSEGKNFRGNGFRRAKKISYQRGAWILARADEIEKSSKSLWGWLRMPMQPKSQGVEG